MCTPLFAVDEEAVLVTLEHILQTLEARVTTEQARTARTLRRQQRAQFHPATGGLPMRKLLPYAHTHHVAASGTCSVRFACTCWCAEALVHT